MGSTTGYQIPTPGAAWFKAKIAEVKGQVAEARRAAQAAARVGATAMASLADGQRLGAVSGQVSDANAASNTGWYHLVMGGANGPDPTSHWEIKTLRLASGGRYQEALRIGVIGAFALDRWTRTLNGTTWSAWRLMGQANKTFVPTLVNGVTLADGTLTGSYAIADGVLIGQIVLGFGSSTAVTGDILFGLPMPFTGATREVGTARLSDTSTGAQHTASVLINTTALYVRPLGLSVPGTFSVGYLREWTATSTLPFTWATGDVIAAAFQYPIA